MPHIDDTQPGELVTLFAFEAASRLRYIAPRVHLTDAQRDCIAVTEAVCTDIANGRRT